MLVNIIKGGLRQQVSEQAYEALYKPNGWNIDEQAEVKTDPIVETVKELGEPQKISSFIAMTKKTPKKFDDKLFKSGR